jgi:hypothetical protein
MSGEVCRELRLATSAERVWRLVGDFCPTRQWNADIVSCRIASGSNNERGAVRELTVRNGATVRERLVGRDSAARSFSYVIDQSPLPVENYYATLSVSDANGGSVVRWKCTFEAAPGADIAAARAIIEGIYDVGLKSLRALAEELAA